VVEAFLARRFTDHRWIKTVSKDQLLDELRRLPVRPIFRTPSWQHQLACFYLGLMYPRFLFLLDMGLGKSKVLLDLITQTQREGKLRRALITVPRIINMDSWAEDVERHSDLEPWACNVSNIDEKWDRLGYPKGELTLIDYQGLHWALCDKVKAGKGKFKLVRNDKKIRHVQKLYNWIGIDESHKLSSRETLWFGIMNQLTKSADFCYGTTGTLFGKNVEDLWSQFKLIDRGETFGENLGLFRAGLFTSKVNQWKGIVYTFDKNRQRLLNQMIGHRSLRYDEDEVLDLPERVQRSVFCRMADDQREHYLRALQGLINANGKLSDLDAQYIRMRQIISGYLAWKDEYGDHVLPFKSNPKLDAMERLVDEMGETKMVVVYWYTETGRIITERLAKLGVGYEWFYGGTKDKTASRRRFLDDPKCRVMVMQAEAGGTGNDGLQKVARYMVMYETPTSPTTRKQTIKRIHRPGQQFRSFVYDLVCPGSLDAGILEALAEGIDLHERVVDGKIPTKWLSSKFK